MKRWISEKKQAWMFSLLMGLIVGLSVNFYKLSHVADAQEKVGTFHEIKRSASINIEDSSYWRGRVDSKLESIDKKIDEFYTQIEKLNTHLTEVRISAARDGSIYGGVTSFIVLLVSLVAQGVFKTIKNGKR